MTIIFIQMTASPLSFQQEITEQQALINSARVLLLQVRTLFVSGLPMDTKPRELYLLFRAYEVRENRMTIDTSIVTLVSSHKFKLLGRTIPEKSYQVC